jgi:hypothetical protein
VNSSPMHTVQLGWDQYVKFYMRLMYCFNHEEDDKDDLRPEDIIDALRADWANDSLGGGDVGHEDFLDSIFELALKFARDEGPRKLHRLPEGRTPSNVDSGPAPRARNHPTQPPVCNHSRRWLNASPRLTELTPRSHRPRVTAGVRPLQNTTATRTSSIS